jgi:shikimate dehydrogenase
MSHPEKYLLAGVMGWPIMHSRSPLLHNYWLEKHGLIGRYVPLAIKVEALAAALRALPALGFSGCNLTIPHKVEALTIVDEVSEAGRRIGAVNCIVVKPDGSLSGVNNDGFGFIENIVERAPNWRVDAGPIVVIGAGGGARAAIVTLLDRGAKEIRLVNRSVDRATTLQRQIGGPIELIPWADRHRALHGAATVVNTTSQGMVGQPALDLSLDQLSTSALVTDIVYTPLETPLLAAARRRGNPTVDGLGMLLHQARPAFKAWFGVLPEVTPELRQMIEATL